MSLTTLSLEVRSDGVDVAQLTPLTRLQQLFIDIDKDEDLLDLSGLTTLTKLVAYSSPVSRLPTSLVECQVTLQFDADLSPLTNLTSLCVWIKSAVRVTLPTGLKQLEVRKGKLANTNVGDLALVLFDSGWFRRITRDDLERLPKTLKKIVGRFEPESLKERVWEMFPQLETLSDW